MVLVRTIFVVLAFLHPIPENIYSQISPVNLEELTRRMKAGGDTTMVFNFWATWCSPCIEELPYFEKLHKNSANRPVRVVLVSLDFRSQMDSKVKPFLHKHGYTAPVILLDESDANAYIDRIHPEWSGAIPATLVLHPSSGKRAFYERKFESYEELDQIIQSFIERR